MSGQCQDRWTVGPDDFEGLSNLKDSLKANQVEVAGRWERVALWNSASLCSEWGCGIGFVML